MDEIDEEILELVESGVIKYTAISKRTGIPVSTVHFRVKRLEKDKIITKYKGEIDWNKAGMTVLAFIFVNVDVDMLKKINKTQQQLLRELLDIRYVVDGYVITGESDIILKVIAEDTQELGNILLNAIDSKAGVIKTKTMIVLN